MNEPRIFALGKESRPTVIEVICGGEGGDFACCGEKLCEYRANKSEGAAEKHLPVVEQDGNRITVNVGSVLHPMSEEHSINFVLLETEKGLQRVDLAPTDPPTARFAVAEGDRPVAAYAFCNLHGFWKTEI